MYTPQHPAMCNEEQTADCRNRGGYDLNDPCRNTCRDTSAFDLQELALAPQYQKDLNRPIMMCTMQYVDCRHRGGYDPRDPCNHTCRDTSAFDLQELALAPQYQKDLNRPIMMCTMQYVDCRHRGGYDPRDPCNHTCRDTSAFDLQELAI